MGVFLLISPLPLPLAALENAVYGRIGAVFFCASTRNYANRARLALFADKSPLLDENVYERSHRATRILGGGHIKRFAAAIVAAFLITLSLAQPAQAPIFPTHTVTATIQYAKHAGPPIMPRQVSPTKPPAITSRAEVAEPTVLYAGMATITTYTGIDGNQRGDDVTASGTRATAWRTCAAWGDIPFGSRVVATYSDGHRREYIVEDRGGAISEGKIDVYVGHSNIKEALDFGRNKAFIEIYLP